MLKLSGKGDEERSYPLEPMSGDMISVDPCTAKRSGTKGQSAPKTAWHIQQPAQFCYEPPASSLERVLTVRDVCRERAVADRFRPRSFAFSISIAASAASLASRSSRSRAVLTIYALAFFS